jgi:hypothetical protein
VVARGSRHFTGRRLVLRVGHALRRGRYRVTITIKRGRHAYRLTQTVRVS